MSKALLKSLNGLVSFVVVVAMAAAGLYAGYALWDNQQIYSAAEGVQNELLAFKPKDVSDDGGEAGPSFDELLAINPDVCAWITMDNTAIDHVVLQGETNLTYINTDAYKRFALAGSIFLDSRCDPTFADDYSLFYGHHMVNHGMFGDLDLYKDAKFFEENNTGTLMTPGEVHACGQRRRRLHAGHRRRGQRRVPGDHLHQNGGVYLYHSANSRRPSVERVL